MITFTILAIMAIIAVIAAIAIIGTVGGATIVVFGDIAVFLLIVWVIIKLIFRKKQ